MTDFIGDVHGHADKLEELLMKLGYSPKNGCYSHPASKVVFVGDYIDRGPQILKTLEIVKRMVDSGNAIALMGNHEYNALCFHFQESEGGHLRKHLIKNIIQHFETLKQFQNRQEQYEVYLEWFKTLPLFYETEDFRVVHACWDINQISYLKTVLHENKLADDTIYHSAKKGSALNIAVETILKGKEIKLPAGITFLDKDGTARDQIRIKWWEDPTKQTYRSISVENLDNIPEIPIQTDVTQKSNYYKQTKPVFFGHYWLKGNPTPYRENICCLDFSVAKNGYLVAYRFDGESKLDVSKMIYV